MLIFNCDECGAQLKLKDESAGKKVRCPSCQAVVLAPAESAGDDATAVSASAPTRRRSADDDDDRPKKRSRRDADSDGVTPATSGKALTCLILSLANCLCLPFVLSLPSIIFGILAIMDVSRHPARIKGKGLAITGIVLSILGNVVMAVLLVVVLIAAPGALSLAALGNIRGAAGRTATVNNLKQIALSMHNYNDAHRQLPPAPGMDLQNPDKPKLSWRVAMLPYMEQGNLYNRFDQKQAWDQGPNNALLQQRPMQFGSPINEPPDPTTTFFQVCIGPNSLFPDTKTPVRLTQITDGMSNTIFAVQAQSNAVPWSKPADIVMTPPGQPLPPQLQGKGLMIVSMCDGSVRTINLSRVSERTLRLAIDPKDGQPLGADWNQPWSSGEIDMNVLLTGGYGCIGSWIARDLLGRGDAVWSYDLKEDPKRLRLILDEGDVRRVRFVQGDVTDLPRLREALQANAITHVVHLAGLQVPTCRADPILGARVNVIGTLVVFEAVRQLGTQVQRLVYTSSAAVFGPSERYAPGRLTDDVPLTPSTHYGVFKCCNEGNARIYHQDFGLSSIGLRPWTVYGVGRDFGMTSEPTKAIKSLALGRPYHITYGGNQDMQYVEDVARTVVCCLERPYQGAKSYNLRGHVVDLPAFHCALCAVEPAAEKLITFGERQIAIAYDLDDSALQRDLGPIPITSLEDGIRQTLAIFRKHQAEGRLDTSDLDAP